jgi:hypothetical protein
VYIFINSIGVAGGHIKQYLIKEGCTLLDHLLVLYKIELCAAKPTNSRYIVNCAYLTDLLIVAKFTAQWKLLSQMMGFFGKIHHTIRWYRT